MVLALALQQGAPAADVLQGGFRCRRPAVGWTRGCSAKSSHGLHGRIARRLDPLLVMPVALVDEQCQHVALIGLGRTWVLLLRRELGVMVSPFVPSRTISNPARARVAGSPRVVARSCCVHPPTIRPGQRGRAEPSAMSFGPLV